MKAFVVGRYGSKVALRASEVADPEVRETDVLIQVHAAGVNLLDSKLRSGEFKLILPYRVPFVLGHDVAGVVLRVGSHVTRFKPGDEVYARPADHRIGTFAEFIAVEEDDGGAWTMSIRSVAREVGSCWNAVVVITGGPPARPL